MGDAPDPDHSNEVAMSYRLSQKRDSKADDVLHHDPAEESCNLDDTQHDEEIDDETATALAAIGTHLCANCFPEGTFV